MIRVWNWRVFLPDAVLGGSHVEFGSLSDPNVQLNLYAIAGYKALISDSVQHYEVISIWILLVWLMRDAL